MIFPFNVYTLINPCTQFSLKPLVVFVLSTSFLKGQINCLLSLLNVSFWAIRDLKGDIIVTIHPLRSHLSLWMLPSLRMSHSTTSCPQPAVTLPLLLPVTVLPRSILEKFASPPIVYSLQPQLDIINLLKPQFLLIDMLLHPWCIAAGTLWIPSQLLTNLLLLIQALDKTYLLLLLVACHMSLFLPTI